MACQTIKDLQWVILSYPVHSPDLSLCDYHFFSSLQNSLEKQQFLTKDKGWRKCIASSSYLKKLLQVNANFLHLYSLVEKNRRKYMDWYLICVQCDVVVKKQQRVYTESTRYGYRGYRELSRRHRIPPFTPTTYLHKGDIILPMSVILQNNTRAHRSYVACQTINNVQCAINAHLVQSPDISSCDHHFLSL